MGPRRVAARVDLRGAGYLVGTGLEVGEAGDRFLVLAQDADFYDVAGDAFIEFYHAPILHMKQAEKEDAEKTELLAVADVFEDHIEHPLAGADDRRRHPGQCEVAGAGPTPR